MVKRLDPSMRSDDPRQFNDERSISVMEKAIKNLKVVQREFNKLLLYLSSQPDLLVTVSVVDFSLTEGEKQYKRHIEVKTSIGKKLL